MKALGVLGTSSGVGKTWVTTALCAWLHKQGVRVAPFKAQNMSNNAWVTVDGGEMARAQAVQAEACGLVPSVEMNPILLKPGGSQGSQLIVKGRAQPHQSAREYYSNFERLWNVVRSTLDDWREKCDVLVLEGAGSPVELNLADLDLVNLRPLHYLSARALLVGDVDRGGIFAQLAGTWHLLSEADRKMFLGAIVNRFRGDISLFSDPNRWLRSYAPGLDVLGTVPLRTDLQPEEEDGLAPGDEDRGTGEVIAWIQLPHVANLTDCQPWWVDEGIRTRWISKPSELADARAIVIPGTKNTLADLRWLRAVGLDKAIRDAAKAGVPVVGICGGYQILGETLADPEGVAGDAGIEEGIGLLPITTKFVKEKVVRQVKVLLGGRSWNAYEIHMGRSSATRKHEPLNRIKTAAGTAEEGSKVEKVLGTYLHGWFDAPESRKLLSAAAGIDAHRPSKSSWSEIRQDAYNSMGEHLSANIDLSSVKQYLKI